MVGSAASRASLAALSTLDARSDVTTGDKGSVSICAVANVTSLPCLGLTTRWLMELTGLFALLFINLHVVRVARGLEVCLVAVRYVRLYALLALDALRWSPTVDHRHVFQVVDVRAFDLEDGATNLQIITYLDLMERALLALAAQTQPCAVGAANICE